MNTMITLKDGQKVPNSILMGTIYNLKMVAKENIFAIIDLVEKCKDAHFRFNPFTDSKRTLRRWALLQPSGEVHEYINSIVLNSVKRSGMKLHIVSPIYGDDIKRKRG